MSASEELIADLAAPGVLDGSREIEVVQTHASVVFLTSRRAFKLKKPRDLGFLDHSTRAKRLDSCRAEVELNRRLAPRVYLGVRDVVRDAAGRHRLAAPDHSGGTVVDHVVEMARLPDAARLSTLVGESRAEPGDLQRLAGLLARFHDEARRGEDVRRCARADALRSLLAGNLAEAREAGGDALGATGWARLEERLDEELDRVSPLLDARVARDRPCDGHGDLRLEHCYYLDDGIVVVDCIEFAERFRFADPVLDVSFLVMELEHRGRADLARAFLDAWSEAQDDRDAETLLPAFVAHRHLVRGKVAALQAAQDEVAPSQRHGAGVRASRHALAALERLSPVGEAPCLVLVGGLPGSGKSTLARNIAEEGGFRVVSTDEVRKELAGLDRTADAAAEPDAGLYAPERRRATYRDVAARCHALLRDGARVLADASFTEGWQRALLLDVADSLGAAALFLECRLPEEIARRRLAARRGDASDADAAIRTHLAAGWEPPDDRAAAVHSSIDTSVRAAEAAAHASDLIERRIDARRA